MDTNDSFNTYKPTRHPGQLREVVGDNVEQYCKHESCPICNGTGFNKDRTDRCVHAIVCNCPKCLGYSH